MANPTEKNHPFLLVGTECGDALWTFLTVKDLLQISVLSKSAALLLVPSLTLNTVLKRNEAKLGMLGNMKLNFPTSLTFGMMRRAFTRLRNTIDASVLVDERHGRIVIDIGSAYYNPDTHYVAEVEQAEEEPEEGQQIVRSLEIYSYDEYDDFNPRHPLPKDRAHRRGDSYFNSDVEMVVNELSGHSNSDVTNLAKLALLNDNSETPLTADPSEKKLSAKDRILGNKKYNTNKAGVARKLPTVKSSQMNDEEDD